MVVRKPLLAHKLIHRAASFARRIERSGLAEADRMMITCFATCDYEHMGYATPDDGEFEFSWDRTPNRDNALKIEFKQTGVGRYNIYWKGLAPDKTWGDAFATNSYGDLDPDKPLPRQLRRIIGKRKPDNE